MSTPRIVYIDIETFPLRVFTWEVYEANAIAVDKPRIISAFSAKWHKGKQITKALCDYPGYRPGMDWKGYEYSDKKILKDIWNILDECDVAIAHNGKAFDIKTINTQFVKHGMKPTSSYKQVDTLKESRKEFKFPSNKLDALGRELQVGRKLPNEGHDLWLQCLAGDKRAWRIMKKYNAQDVILLESVYHRFLPWIHNHPNYNLWSDRPVCTNCGEKRVKKCGIETLRTGKYQTYKCNTCGHRMRGDKVKKLPLSFQ